MGEETEPNSVRVHRLLDATWPTSTAQIASWLRAIGQHPRRHTAAGVALLGDIEPSIHRNELVGVHWFTSYPGDDDLRAAHRRLSRFVTARLGDPVDELVHPVYGTSRLWRTPEFTVDTYAHIQRSAPPTGASLQVHVDLTGPADKRNAEDELRERKRHGLD